MILVCSPFFPAFGIKAEIKKIPILYSVLVALKSFFIERGSDVASRNKLVEEIKNRQMLIEENPD